MGALRDGGASESEASRLTRMHIRLTAQDLGGVQRVLTVLAQRGYPLVGATIETRATQLKLELVVDTVKPELLLARLRRIVSLELTRYSVHPDR